MANREYDAAAGQLNAVWRNAWACAAKTHADVIAPAMAMLDSARIWPYVFRKDIESMPRPDAEELVNRLKEKPRAYPVP